MSAQGWEASCLDEGADERDEHPPPLSTAGSCVGVCRKNRLVLVKRDALT